MTAQPEDKRPYARKTRASVSNSTFGSVARRVLGNHPIGRKNPSDYGSLLDLFVA